MSENIQSISQGTFTIGQTSATNFQAGPGIKIDQPSEGVVRIGNDETVLWEGTYSGSITSTNYITLSEAPSAFESVKIINGGGYKSCYEFDGKSDVWSYMQTYAATGSSTVYANRYSVNQSSKTVTCLASNSFGVNANSITNWTNRTSMNVGETQLIKVIGINRKEV